MKFKDKLDRKQEEDIFVIRKHKEAVIDGNVEVIRELPTTQGLCFCRTTIKSVNIQEAIYEQSGEYITYRIE